jgi:hypothetical protein
MKCKKCYTKMIYSEKGWFCDNCKGIEKFCEKSHKKEINVEDHPTSIYKFDNSDNKRLKKHKGDKKHEEA